MPDDTKFAAPWMERREPGDEVEMPTRPLPSITNLSLVPMTDELDILNLPLSFESVPIAQLFKALLRFATVLDAENTSWGELAAVDPAL